MPCELFPTSSCPSYNHQSYIDYMTLKITRHGYRVTGVGEYGNGPNGPNGGRSGELRQRRWVTAVSGIVIGSIAGIRVG